MKCLTLFFLVAWSSLSFAPHADSSTVPLLDAAIHQYLKEMQAQHAWVPVEFIIEAEDKTTFSQLRSKHGPTSVVIKTPQELENYSKQHVGKTVDFFSLDIEEHSNHFQVFIVTESIRTIMQEGAPTLQYQDAQQGKACALHFDQQLSYRGIDCLSANAAQD